MIPLLRRIRIPSNHAASGQVRMKGIFVRSPDYKPPWIVYDSYHSEHDFHPLEHLYSNDFAKKQRTRKSLWYHKLGHKRANTVIQHLNYEMVVEAEKKRPLPKFNPGDAVEVHFKGNGEATRPNKFQGVVIGIRKRHYSSSFKVLGVVEEASILYNFPLYSPLLTDVKILKKSFLTEGKKRIRRAKLNYLIGRPPSQYNVVSRKLRDINESKHGSPEASKDNEIHSKVVDESDYIEKDE